MAVTIDGSGEITGLDEINNIPLPTTGFGKVLQIVRATDSTERSTTSGSFVDANLSVTITPQKSTSAIIVVYVVSAQAGNNGYVGIQITDSSNNALSGATLNYLGDGTSTAIQGTMNVWGYSTPATTSATTYKARFNTFSGTAKLKNAETAGQIYAIEVSA